jgi:S-adenosylhomocysteine hydrolase
MEYDVKDIALADQGFDKIEWAERRMPVLRKIMWKNGKKLEKKVYSVPKDIDENISFLKLASAGITIDELTEEQKKYLASWEMGT